MIHRVRAIRSNLHLKNSVRTRSADPLDRNPNPSQILSQPPVIDRQLNKLANPLRRKFHSVPPASRRLSRGRPRPRTRDLNDRRVSKKRPVILKRVLCAEGTPATRRQNRHIKEFSRWSRISWLTTNDQRRTTNDAPHAHRCKNLTSP